MEFDILTEREACGIKIEYGILRGGENIVFIKVGRGGTYRGTEDKYLRFALRLREKFGASVVCASNPDGCKTSWEADVSVLREYASTLEAPRFHLFGYSDGGFKCIDIAENLPFKKAVLANMPLMINFYKTKERMKKLGGAGFAFVYGEQDPSFKFIPFIRSLEGPRTELLAGTGHMSAYTEEECELFENLLFS